ncbi:ribonuclease HII [Peptostreptococcus canis]|uniref:ribonuclease HII n=1 Tax=Peptostreptococcus canis TaxID=1159213 RepID=UPI0016231EF0|nr:ribonuclease HII [Peptostreptococcus canis]MBP1998921.1 ribonuclease HII [Peptostreptococcus canis]
MNKLSNILNQYNVDNINKLKTKDIKTISEKINIVEYREFIDIFKLDNRKSIQDICNKLEKKLEKQSLEFKRLEKINFYENQARNEGYIYIGGVDEAGRGPLAGPVVAAVVLFERDTKIEGINDSKKLSEAKREELFSIIKEKAIDYGIGIADNLEIDRYNILNATYIAMKRAISELKLKPDCLLNDAVIIPELHCKQIPIIKGDSKSISIAAASILAKVTRDRMMYEYDKKFPGYGFSSNKGYGTAEHYKGIEKYGKTKIHRESFLKNIK